MTPGVPEKIGIVLPTLNRREFVKCVLEALLENTNPQWVEKLLVVDGPSTDGTSEYLAARLKSGTPFPCELVPTKIKHVVRCMNLAYDTMKTRFIAKIDSDTVVPPGWLEACAQVLRAHPKLYALGIEPRFPRCSPDEPYGYVPAQIIGGIGLFRREAWAGLKARDAPYYGWTEHQLQSPWIKGWITPSIHTVLIDALPFDPWYSLSKGYKEKGWQRTSAKINFSRMFAWGWKFPDWRRTLVKPPK